MQFMLQPCHILLATLTASLCAARRCSRVIFGNGRKTPGYCSFRSFNNLSLLRGSLANSSAAWGPLRFLTGVYTAADVPDPIVSEAVTGAVPVEPADSSVVHTGPASRDEESPSPPQTAEVAEPVEAAEETVVVSAEPSTAEERLLEAQRAFFSKYDVEVTLAARDHSTELDPLATIHKEAPKAAASIRFRASPENDRFVQRLVARSDEIRKGDLGLPFVTEKDCKLDEPHAMMLATASSRLGGARPQNVRTIRTRSASGMPLSQSQNVANELASLAVYEELHKSHHVWWKRPDAVGGLVQILQVQPVFVREELLRLLSNVDSPQGTLALAERALFDASPEMRRLARHHLTRREIDTPTRRRLLGGFKYPWPPVAAFAAQALVELNDRESIPDLIDLLDARDPTAPFLNDEGVPVRRTLVRLSHMRNCVLCHEAASPEGRVPGFVPISGQPLPRAYYHSPSRSSGSFVRADITYLRQDFSQMHFVENAKPWPERQRFDYLIQTRRLTPDEQTRFLTVTGPDGTDPAPSPPACPQREAVLVALRGLTGSDRGDSSVAWRASSDPTAID